ncbi:MAG: hypothetical protein ACM3UU_11220 [Ignavibacteriales bacterium]
MKNFYWILAAILFAFLYLFLTNNRVDLDKSLLTQANSNSIEKKLQTDLSSLKQKILVPVEKRNSYILNEQKLNTYKELTKDTISNPVKTSKTTTKRSSKSGWKRR